MLKLKEFQLNSMSDAGVVAMVGRRGSGKSTILTNIMYEKRRIPDGIGCSGSEESNGALARFMPETYIYNDYNKGAVQAAVDRARALNRNRQEKHMPMKYTFIILDDCSCDKAFTGDPLLKFILMNGRHYGIFFIFTMQYPLAVGPQLRSQIDYVFLSFEPILKNRRTLYENYAGVFPLYNEFSETMAAVCQDYRCMVIVQNKPTSSIEECVFWFKAKPAMPDFKVGSVIYWEAHFAHYDAAHAMTPLDDKKLNKKKYKVKVQLISH